MGNTWADAAAKQGRDLHAVHPKTVEECKKAKGFIVDYVRLAGCVAKLQGEKGMPKDTE